ncbi:MAG: response regulator [Myxococcales bacterium]|nr:response regulator [Myxococcales bacterium]
MGSFNPERWRESLLRIVLRVGLGLGVLVYVPSVAIAWQLDMSAIVIADTLAVLVVAWLALVEPLTFTVRAAMLCAVLFSLGVVLLALVGPVAQIYLLGFSLIATLLLRMRVGLGTVALNAATMLSLGLLGHAAPEMTLVGWGESPTAWAVVTVNFVFVNALLVAALGAIVGSLEEITARERHARQALETEQASLVATNERLEREVAERRRTEEELRASEVRERALEDERKSLDAQVQHAQKMDAIGRLAGGIAHDFNNMLSVIAGYASLARESVPDSSELQSDLGEILKATERSTQLTSQLLAFARRQPIAPQVFELDEAVESTLRMLRRLVGEDIQVMWKPGRAGVVRMDPAQLDQVLVNLAVNARDAIGGVGLLSVETSHVTLDEEYVRMHVEAREGSFAVLAVSDDGCGMDEATRARIFEPFFTTKPIGAGTGLGLATVYGIIKQNDGLIRVYSEPGRGTTFRVYLPSALEAEATVNRASTTVSNIGGEETILLVEDEPTVRELTARLLERLGYRVLVADGPRAALELSAAHAEEIHLLVTDVVMPQMSGRDVREALTKERPAMRCLYVSGYTADLLSPEGVLEEGVHFLPKPFAPSALAAKVREALAT